MKTLLMTASLIGFGLLTSAPAISACAASGQTKGGGCGIFTGTKTFTFKLATLLSVSNTVTMEFGSVVRPGSGSGSIALNASSGSCVVTRTSVVSLSTPTPRCASFAISGGTANGAITVTVASSSLTSGANTLTLTPNNSSATTLNASGALTVLVGGTVALASTTKSGTYTGTVTLTAASN